MGCPCRLLAPRYIKDKDWRKLLEIQPFLRYDRNSVAGRQVERFLRKVHFAVRNVSELDELKTLVALVAAGMDVA